MAYTNATFNPAVPAGTSQLSGGDDSIRSAKLDLKERLETLVVSIDNDPLVLKPIIVNTPGVQLMFGPQILKSKEDQDDVETQSGYVMALDADARPMFGTIVLPVGVIITLFEAWMDRNGPGNSTISLSSVVASTGITTSITGDLLTAAAGIVQVTSGVLAKTVLNTEFLVIRFVAGVVSSGRCHGMRVTYTRPDLGKVY